MVDIDEIECIIVGIDDIKGDCDATSDAVSARLNEENIPHNRLIGYMRDTQRKTVVLPHCWIELLDGTVIDLRLRRWLGELERVPHGVFVPPSHYCYVGINDLRDRSGT